LRQARIYVQINTNGTLLDKLTCRHLKRLGVTKISVSLDGSTAQINGATRGKSSYKLAVTGIGNLVEVGIKPSILMTLTTHNLDDLRDTVIVCRRLGATNVAIADLSATGRGIACYDALRLSAREWHVAVGRIRRLQAEYPGFVQEGFSFWEEYPERMKKASQALVEQEVPRCCLLPCDAAKTFCAITADGWVIPCNKYDSYRCGNLRETDLRSIWLGDRMEAIRKLAQVPVREGEICRMCYYHTVCSGGCRADAYKAFSTLDAPDPACAILAESAIHLMHIRNEAKQ
jgi:radical SAM protein with 4Fe4S-binding SPASM domain